MGQYDFVFRVNSVISHTAYIYNHNRERELFQMAMTKCTECNQDISDKAKACPHCGYPLVEEKEDVKYSLNLGSCGSCGLAKIFYVTAVLTWIGGLIAAIILSNVPDGRYSTKWSFWVFLLYCAGFAFAGLMQWLFGRMVEAIHETRDMVAGLKLVEISNKSVAASSHSSTSYFSKLAKSNAPIGEWTCKNCGTKNRQSAVMCKDCGKYR